MRSVMAYNLPSVLEDSLKSASVGLMVLRLRL